MFKYIFGIGLVWLSSISSVLALNRNNIFYDHVVLGNYPDYMDPDLLNWARTKYKIATDNFSHDHIVKTKLRENLYDAAIVSTSVLQEIKDYLLEIDWSKLKIKKSANDSSYISSSNEIKSIFTNSSKSIIENNNDFFKYGIPYFLNKLSFCYIGSEIESLKGKVSWNTLISSISKEERFKNNKNSPRIAMIDDPRTVFSLARFLGNDKKVNFGKDEHKNFYNFFDTYKSISSNGLNRNNMVGFPIYFDSNSASLVDSLSLGSVNGGFMYNGDCLYASYGGNSSVKHEKDKFHIVETDSNIYFLDFFVISKRIKKHKLDNLYEFISKVMFESYYDKENILDKDGDEYKNYLAKNFDYVKYTPIIDNLKTKVESDYFEGDLKDTQKKIFSIDANNNIEDYYEKPLNSKQKSDMMIAFERFKLSL